MRHFILLFAAAAAAHAAPIGAAVSANSADDNFVTEAINPDLGGFYGYDGNAMLDTWNFAGISMFGITSQGAPGGALPGGMVDTSLGGPDTVGIIQSTDSDRFFGVVDPGLYGGGGEAMWTFDISGGGAVDVNVDFAAMGDFRPGGARSFEYSIDGAPFAPLFDIVNVSITQPYTLEDGSVVNLDDPLQVDGVTLTNNFQTFNSGVLGSGSSLTLKFTSQVFGGQDKPFAFRNVQVVPEPASLVLLAISGLLVTRRR